MLDAIGKGGKGLGKGGAKRRRKVLRGNIQSITKAAIRRLARRGGVQRISGLIYGETQQVLDASTHVAELQDELSGFEYQLALAQQAELEAIADVDQAREASVITPQQMSAAYDKLDCTGYSNPHHSDVRANFVSLLLQHHPNKGGDPDSYSQCKAAWDVVHDFDNQLHAFNTADERLKAVQEFRGQADAACRETAVLLAIANRELTVARSANSSEEA